jgi:hypothetical protein
VSWPRFEPGSPEYKSESLQLEEIFFLCKGGNMKNTSVKKPLLNKVSVCFYLRVEREKVGHV